MSDELNWPVNAPPETETLRDENLLGSYAPLSTLPGKKQRKTTFLQFRTWIASKIGTASIKDVALNQNVIPANISEAYTNEVDPDLTGWVGAAAGPAIDSGQRFEDQILYNVPNAGNGVLYKDIAGSTFSITDPDFTIVGRRGSSALGSLVIYEGAGFTGLIGRMNIDFDNNTVTDVTGVLKKAEWKDSNTVILHCTSIAFTLTSVIRFGLFQAAVGHTYWGLPQAVDSTTMFPFVDGSKTADVINKSVILIGRSTHIFEIEPRFAYDTTTNHYFGAWRLDSTHFFQVFYDQAIAKFRVVWKDGGNIRNIYSQQFGAGGSFEDINQKIYLIISADLVSGGINDSRFIVITDNGTTVNEFTAWDGTPDVQNSLFPIMAIGNNGQGILHADLIHRLYRMFNDLLVGTVTSINDVWTALAGETPLFSATSSPTVDRDSIDENTSTQNAIEKNASSIQLLKSFDNPHYIGSTNEPVFLNLWVNGAGSYSNAYYIKRADGWVDIYGEIITGTVDQNAFEFDNGWKPFYKKDKTFPIESNGAFGAVTITADGFLKPITPSSNTSVILDGISFYAGF